MKHASWILTLAVAVACTLSAGAQSRQAPRIVVNDRVIQTDVAPRILQGTTLVPIRFVAQALGADVVWDPIKRQAIITLEAQNVIVQTGSDEVVAGDRVVEARVPTQVIQGRTMVPLRAVSEGLGATVEYVPATNTVVIRTAEAAGTGSTPSPADVVRQAMSAELRVPENRYRRGVPIPMALRVQNTGDRPILLQMPTGQQYDFLVERDGTEVWRWSQGQVFTQALSNLTFDPDEVRTFTIAWDQRDNAGNLVPAGTYTISGILPNMANVSLRSSRTVEIAR